MVKWIKTDRLSTWELQTVAECREDDAQLVVNTERYQSFRGFGGCFNELGWYALNKLDQEKKDQVLDSIFTDQGCRFNVCRIPIGASDYALEWYSNNECDGDYDMQHFNIHRDRQYLIPYIKEACKRRDDISFFASPWSPPIWLKQPKAYNYGTIRWDKKVLDAYALYFLKFVEAYKSEGINVEQIHVQNEPISDQKFPSCVWTGAQLRDFIRDHLGPLFKANGMPAEIWLGTLNGPYDDFGSAVTMSTDYDAYANTVLFDDKARQYISGIGYQWGGKHAISLTYQSWPEMRLMQTESECGDGTNSWEYARYIFNLIRHYLYNGAEAYVYWNMVLCEGGMSTWGWKQNSLVCINPENGQITYNPEFYLMKHFSHFVKPGARIAGIRGRLCANSVAFENPDGQIVVVMANPFKVEKNVSIFVEGHTIKVTLSPESFNTFVF